MCKEKGMSGLSKEKAFTALKEGNARFAGSSPRPKDFGEKEREALAAGQYPFAAVLGCSDSRIPPELVFDQGVGDLFVVRVAGNIASAEAVGSIEYAVDHLRVPLIVVLGHEKCGAVTAAASGAEAAGSVCSIVDALGPSLEEAKKCGATGDELVEACANENVHAAAEALRRSPIVAAAIDAGTTGVVEGKYCLESGVVEWLREDIS
jgi:carbonic anhydrase